MTGIKSSNSLEVKTPKNKTPHYLEGFYWVEDRSRTGDL